ncbi:MAG: rhomboid family intramembrane serine protease [Candidatus Odinarchaeia archaeon]
MYYVPTPRTDAYSKKKPYATYIIILANIIVYIIENLNLGFYNYFVYNYGLMPINIVSGNALYTLITSMFLHAGLFETYGIFHIFFNMYILFLFGPDVEKTFGTPLFFVFYFFSGIAAGLFHSYVVYLMDPTFSAYIPTIGASGAIFGVMAGYAIFYPNRRLFTFFGPIKAFYLIILFVIVETAFAFMPIAGFTGIANTAHVGGFIGGFVFSLVFRYVSGKFPKKKKKKEEEITVIYL